MENKNEEFEGEIQGAFASYPRPTGNAEFDARFWRALDARGQRYRGVGGWLRRWIEVEIEGIAVWRLGLALFGGAATCAVGVALLGLGSSPISHEPSAPAIAQMPTDLPSSSRYARELWDERELEYVVPKSRAEKPKVKEELSCVSFARDLV